MTPELGKKYLITTDNWFFAPDGENYKAVFGTVSGVLNDKDSLGLKTNRHSTDWYVVIGNMMIAGCQVHYCIQADDVDFRRGNREIEHNGKMVVERNATTRIYNADE